MGTKLIGYQYLDKFFDLQFSLKEINIEKYIRALKVIDTLAGDYFDICVMEICVQFNFSLRQINRFLNLVSLVYNYINYRENMNESILAKCILFPIMLGIKIYDINVYNKIINGNGENELREIIIKNTNIISVFNNYFNVEQNEEILNFDFSELYRKLFSNTLENEWNTIKIGKREVKYLRERKRLMELLSFLNEFVQL